MRFIAFNLKINIFLLNLINFKEKTSFFLMKKGISWVLLIRKKLQKLRINAQAGIYRTLFRIKLKKLKVRLKNSFIIKPLI